MTNADVDIKFIQQAVELADVNALRIALYQQTGDEELAAMEVSNELREGSPFRFTRLVKSNHELVKKKALAYLRSPPDSSLVPDKLEAAKLMKLFCGRDLTPADIDYAWGDLGFEGFTRGAQWNNKPAQSVLDAIDITVVGAGFGGLLAAIQLQRLGLNCRIIERQAGIGGTWWLNQYPEARVDIASYLYQYKFELGYKWKSYYATQKELLEYFDFIVDKYELRDKISLNTHITHAQWVEDDNKWHLTAEDSEGKQQLFRSNFFISASGQFSKANLPDIDGIETFEGKMFHSTNWDHSYDFAGKRVAVIGTGSTGAQMCRGLAKTAASLTVYQRSPNWTSRMPNYRDAVPAELQWLLDTMPGYLNWHVFSQHIAQMRMDGMNEIDEQWVAQGGFFNQRNDQLRENLIAYIKKSVEGDEKLAAQLTPKWAPLARRPVVDNEFYATLTQEHVNLITDPIDRFTSNGIQTSGTEPQTREFDLVVLAAGYEVEAFLWPVEYSGRQGTTLGDLWDEDGPRAYLTAMLPGFPNFAMMYGPNSGLVAGSYHSWVELFSNYYCQVITRTIESGASSFEVKREAYDAFNQELDERAKTWVFQIEDTGGGYYKNKKNRSAVRLPWRTPEFYQKVATPNYDHFSLR